MTKSTFDTIAWCFDNSYTHLPQSLFMPTFPKPVAAPSLIILNQSLATSLGLNIQSLSDKELAELFSGNILPTGAEPIAQAYAGHQYGHFTLLGDGRALLLGEHLTPDNKRVDIQLKGSGPTPYSRRGDGRAALGPMLREYIISESMHALGVPTTRSLAVVDSGESVYRETKMPGAILTRIASSHIRIGTFEYLAAKQDRDSIEILVNYTIERHFPELTFADNPSLALLDAFTKRLVNLIIEWMRVGFIHGVMNTDNILISGETIDYGPCAFMDEYDPQAVFSSIDQGGRYAYANQPAIAQWNLARFAECLLPLLDSDSTKALAMANEIILSFETLYQQGWLDMMRKKLGLFGEEETDINLVNDLLNWMHSNQQDFTNTFIALSEPSQLNLAVFKDEFFKSWHQRWKARFSLHSDLEEQGLCLMRKNNPAIIPRNHVIESVLSSASENNDLEPFNTFLTALLTPYSNRPEIVRYQNPPSSSERVRQTFCGT